MDNALLATNGNFVSPTDSGISSKQSFVSRGDEDVGEGSWDENDNTTNLQHEFDEHKKHQDMTTPNRIYPQAGAPNDVLSSRIASPAVAISLLDDKHSSVDSQDLRWGCDPNPKGTDIEASALFEVFDWLKRNESASSERKRAFMEESLNKMVASVRHGVIDAETATRTMHESAALLSLELAEPLSATTLIISGMRKTTTADDMIRAFREFGDIEVAAVASGNRGFGIVRFLRAKAADRALRRYRSAEIVILDVSIQMKVIAQDSDLIDES